MGTLSDRRRWVRAARFILYGVAVLAAVLGSAALFLPDLLDTPPVRAEIQRRLASAFHADLAWESLRVRILPWPHGTLSKFRIDKPGVGSVGAESLDVQLRLGPLLRGRAEILSLTVVKPVITIGINPPAMPEKAAPQEQRAAGIVETYRSVMGAILDVSGRFAPDTVLTIDDASVDARVLDLPPIQLSKLSLRARSGDSGLQIDVATAGNTWKQLSLSARLDRKDLSGAVRLDIDGIRPAAWLDRFLAGAPVAVAVPEGALGVRARTDGRTRLESDIDLRAATVAIARGTERVDVPGIEMKCRIVADAEDFALHVEGVRAGASRVTGGALRYSRKGDSLVGDLGYELDLAQGVDYTRRLAAREAGAALDRIQSVNGRAHGRVKLAIARDQWSVGVGVNKSDAALQIRDIPGPVRLASGEVEVDRHAVKASRVAVSMPAGDIVLSTLRHSLKDGTTAGGAEFDLDLPNTMELVRRVLPEENRDALSVIESIAGRAKGTAKVALARENWSAEVDISKANAQVRVRGLPGPAGLAAGSVRVTPGAVDVERAALALLDATAIASATISDFGVGPRVRGSVAEAVIGERLLDWAWEIGKAPPHLKLKSPVRAAASSFAWGPKQALDVQATARFDAGPSVAVELGWTPAALEVRRAAVKDDRSDAVMSARIAGPQLEGKFSGSLSLSSIGAMLRSATVRDGRLSGDFRLAIDREDARRTRAEGSLKGETLDFAGLTGQPLKIERIDLTVDGDLLRIGDATFDWAGQRASLRGDIRRSEGAPVINAQLESPGLVVDALLKAEARATSARSDASADSLNPPPDAAGKASRIWPLPVTGRIEFRSEFVQSGRHKVAPLAGILTLEERRAHVDLKQADLCGISLPLVVEATPQTYSVSARVTAQKLQLEQSAHCLTGEGVLISGLYDLNADIRTQGRPAELLHNLAGTIRTDAQDGKVMKFALLGSILSMGNIASLMKPDSPKLDAQGFPYRKLVVAGRFEKGRFLLDEGAFHSDALGIAANGWIALDKPESRLTVLVAPFSRIDELVRKVPVFGYVIGGAFTSVPVGVSGDIRDPLVVPLGPGAVTSEVLGIFERTLKVPAKLVTPADPR